MVTSFRDTLSKLCRAPPDRRPPRRARLGFYGYRYRKARKRSAIIARGAVAAALLIATIAAASGQIGR
jgi:hypothetical protein